MIKSKSDLKEYLYYDSIARWGHKPSIIDRIKLGKMWRFHVLLRKREYNLNCREGMLSKLIDNIYIFLLRRLTYCLGWDIPPNVFGKGLCIVHIGPVIVNEQCKIGNNCRIQAMVNIGANHECAPTIGDDVYIGPGAKIFGGITIGNSVKIGANAVVNKSFPDNVVIVGVPAKIVKEI